MSGRTLRVWLDAQLPPDLATWLSSTFEVAAEHVVDLGLLHATDESIFARARAENAVVMTKDADFVQLVERLGAPPRVVWLTVGNISNAELRAALQGAMAARSATAVDRRTARRNHATIEHSVLIPSPVGLGIASVVPTSPRCQR